MPVGKAALLSAAALVLAIVAGGLFILALGYNPIDVYVSIVQGAFRSKLAIQGTVKLAVPLLITSLGITLAFKMKFWNIGAEGQIIMGGIFATYFALFHNDWPHWLLIAVMLLAGAVGGGLWGLVPAFFKTRFGTNETLLTLMLNYIALYLIKFFAEGPWKDPTSSGFPKIANFDKNARLDSVLGVQCGWIIALVLVALVFVYMKYTKQGYEISVVGESENTARYAGMSVKKIVLRTMFLSGAICGVAGMTQATGTAYTLSAGLTAASASPPSSSPGWRGSIPLLLWWLRRCSAYWKRAAASCRAPSGCRARCPPCSKASSSSLCWPSISSPAIRWFSERR